MASAPMPDPSQQGAPQGDPQGDPSQGSDPGAAGAAPSGAPAPPELMMLAQMSKAIDQLAQRVPPASAGLAKAKAGINEAMSAMVTQPQQQAPSQSPPY